MYAARVMGLEVPETIVSNEFSRYMIERFDLDSRGEQLGFVDMCAISGLPARDKYASSAERIVRMLEAACDSTTIASSLDTFFAQYLLATVIRNGDAHLKNFGLLYGKAHPTAISPVYDMLSMAVYAPKRNDGDAGDGMALTLNGTKRWPSRAMLDDLARRCGMSPSRQLLWEDRMQCALVRVGVAAAMATIDNAVDDGTRAAIGRMLELWAFGVCPYSAAAAKEVVRCSALALS